MNIIDKMEETKHQAQTSQNKSWYDKAYRWMLLPPIILMILSLAYIGFFYSQTGELINKDSSLAGGTTITLNPSAIDSGLTAKILKDKISVKVNDVNVREVKDLTSGKLIALIVDSSVRPEILQKAVEEAIGISLNGSNSSIEFTGGGLSGNFYKQLLIAIALSFVLMSIVIFIMFKSFVPSGAVIFAAFSDIVMPLALMNFLGIKISAAGIAAFLMLIGYSVDTDILLTTRVIKKSGGTVNSRIFGAFKTGIFMNTTALIAVLPAFFVVTGLPDSFRQIFLILVLGLVADVLNTWLTNASIIKWYADRKGLK